MTDAAFNLSFHGDAGRKTVALVTGQVLGVPIRDGGPFLSATDERGAPKLEHGTGGGNGTPGACNNGDRFLGSGRL